MTVRITSISTHDAGEELCIGFEICGDGEDRISREQFIISLGQYLTLGLTKGECDTDVFDEVSHASEVWQATKKATVLLGFGAHSARALRAKLISKGFDRQAAGEAVDSLCARGILNEAEDALNEARKMLKKLWGRRRIMSALGEKGYTRESVSYAIDALEADGVDYTDNCRRLVQSKYGSLPNEPDKAEKAIAALMRYGYSISEIKKVLH